MMTAHSANLPPEPEEVAQYGPPTLMVLQSIHTTAQQRLASLDAMDGKTAEATSPPEPAKYIDYDDAGRAKHDEFVAFCLESEIEPNPTSQHLADEQQLAHAIQRFVWNTTQADVQTMRDKDSSYSAKLLSPHKLDGLIDIHYKQHGTDRRIRSPEQHKAEEAYLASGKRPVYSEVTIYDGTTQADGSPGPSTVERRLVFPQFGLIMTLRDAFIDDKNWVAAKAAEVTLAAAGWAFLNSIQERIVKVVNVRGETVRIVQTNRQGAEIPEDMRANTNYRPRAPRE